jgi:hypothetical protein
VEGILRRLSAEGSEAENAIRVIAFFDRLVETRAGLEELIRSSARLVSAPAGFASETLDKSWAFDARGRPLDSEVPHDAFARSVVTDSRTAGIVWVQSFSKNAALGDLIIERMGLAASIILGRAISTAVSPDTSPLGQLLAREIAAQDRANSAWSLGFRVDWTVRVLVAATEGGLSVVDSAIQSWAKSRDIKCSKAQIDDRFIVALIQDVGNFAVTTYPNWSFLSALGSRVSVLEAYESLETARQAIYLTSADLGPKFVDYENLGPLVHIAALSPTVAKNTNFVEQLTFLSQSEVGRGELIALDTFCRFHSLRAASAQMNLHHSSLAHRLKNAEKKLNIDLSDSQTFLAVSVALQLFRISQWV